MAIINKTGITNGGTIQAEHITRVIDALSGVSTDSLVLTGSLQGTASFATSASRAASSSLATNAKNVEITDNTSYGGVTYYPTFVGLTTGFTHVLVDSATFTYNPNTNVLNTTSSFAITASHALNANASGEYVTLNFIHTPRTGTTTGTKTAFGIFPVGVTSESRIAAVTPFNCIIVSASLSTQCGTPGSTGKVNYDLVWYNGASNVSQSLGYVDLTNFIPNTLSEHRQYVGASMDAGRNIYIKMTDGTTDASVVYSSHMAVLLKKV